MTTASPRARRRRRLVALGVAAAAALPTAAACGDTETVVVTRTVHTGTGTVATGPGNTVGGGTDQGSASLDLRLPAPASIPGLKEGEVKRLPTAADLVGALYVANDPTAAPAIRRLQGNGYSDGVIRDQQGEATTGPRLVRTYIFRVRDNQTARAEVDTSITEIRSTTTLPIADIDLPEANGRGIRIVGGGQQIVFVTFAAGRDVYGIQSFAPAGRRTYEKQIVELSGNLYRAWNDTP